MLTEAELEQDFPYAHEAWVADGVYGMLFSFENEGQSAADVADYQLEWMRESCRGRFDGGVKPRGTDAPSVKRYFARCDEPKAENDYIVYGTVLVTEDAVLAFEHIGYPEEDAMVAASDDKLAAVLVRYD
jgi:hypothetical protein